MTRRLSPRDAPPPRRTPTAKPRRTSSRGSSGRSRASAEPAEPARFVGATGPDWFVRPAQFGPPDHVARKSMHWLLHPGPPWTCFLTFVPPYDDPDESTYYHYHAQASLHYVISGEGKHYVEGTGHDIAAGSVLYQGPRVRHTIVPAPGKHLLHVAILAPSLQDAFEESICPDSGTIERYGDPAAFDERFGSLDELHDKIAASQIYANERWKAFTRPRG